MRRDWFREKQALHTAVVGVHDFSYNIYVYTYIEAGELTVCWIFRRQPVADSSRCRSSRWPTTGARWWTGDAAGAGEGASSVAAAATVSCTRSITRHARRPAPPPSGSASRSTSPTSQPSAHAASATYLVKPSARTHSLSPSPSPFSYTSPSDGRYVYTIFSYLIIILCQSAAYI